MSLTSDEVAYQEYNRRMSRPQALRRLYGTCQNTSPGTKRGSARIGKAGAASNSPHSIQRRRTTASHTVKGTHAFSQATTPSRQSIIGGGAWSDHPRRPMSWHPGPMAYQSPSPEHVPNDSFLGNTIAEFETLAVSGPVQPLPEDFMSNPTIPAAPERHFINMDPIYDGWNHGMMAGNIDPYSEFPYCNMYGLEQYYGPSPYASIYGDAVPPISNPMETNYDPITSQAATSTSNLPTQYPPSFGYSENLVIPPQISTKKSKELVGMGLYDDKNGSMLSTTAIPRTEGPNSRDGLHQKSSGKGLKLEETWQPPGENLVEEEEDSSGDEAEDLPLAPPSKQPPTHILSGYEDLSNQSFFFDTDDPYTDCIAFDQSMQFCEPKAPDPVSGNFLWF